MIFEPKASARAEVFEALQEAALYKTRYEWLISNIAGMQFDIDRTVDKQGHPSAEFRDVRIICCLNCGKKVASNHERLVELLDKLRKLDDEREASRRNEDGNPFT